MTGFIGAGKTRLGGEELSTPIMGGEFELEEGRPRGGVEEAGVSSGVSELRGLLLICMGGEEGEEEEGRMGCCEVGGEEGEEGLLRLE